MFASVPNRARWPALERAERGVGKLAAAQGAALFQLEVAYIMQLTGAMVLL
jgi:hypothetical protein